MAAAHLHHHGLDAFPAILADPTMQAAVRAKPNVHPVAAAAAAAHAAAAAGRAAAGGGAPSPSPGQQAWGGKAQSGGAATRKKRSNAEVQDTDWASPGAAAGAGQAAGGSRATGAGAKPKKAPKTLRGGAVGAGAAGFGPGPAPAPWLPGPASSLSGGSSATLASPSSAAMQWQAAAVAAAAATGGRARPPGLANLGVLPPGFPGGLPPASRALPSPAGSGSQPWLGSPSVTGVTSTTRASGFHQSADSALRPPPPQHVVGMPPGMPAGMYADMQQQQQHQPQLQQQQLQQQQQQQQHRQVQLSNGVVAAAAAGAGAGGVPTRPTTPALHPMAMPAPAAPGGEMDELWASIGTSQPMAAGAGLDIEQHLDDPVLMELYMKELPIAQALGAAGGTAASSAAHSGPPATAVAAVGSPTSISGGGGSGPAVSGRTQVTASAAAGGEGSGLERDPSVTGGGSGRSTGAVTAAELDLLPDLAHHDDDDHHLDDDWLLHLAADHHLGDMPDMATFDQEHHHQDLPTSTFPGSAGAGGEGGAAGAKAAAGGGAGMGHAASSTPDGLQVVPTAGGEGLPLRPLVTEGSINSCEHGSFKAMAMAGAAAAAAAAGAGGGPTPVGSSGVSPGTPSKQGAAAGTPSSPTSATMRSATGHADGVLPEHPQRGELHEVTSAGCLPQLLQGQAAGQHPAAAAGARPMAPAGPLLQGGRSQRAGAAAVPTSSGSLAEGMGGLGLAGQPSVSTSGLQQPQQQQPQMQAFSSAGSMHVGLVRPPVPPAYVPALVDVLHHPDLTGASPLATAVVAAALGGPAAVAAAVGGRGPLAAAAAGARMAPMAGHAAAGPGVPVGPRPQPAMSADAAAGPQFSKGHMPGFHGLQQQHHHQQHQQQPQPRGPAPPSAPFNGLPGLQHPALTHMVFSAAMGGSLPGQAAQQTRPQQPSSSMGQPWGPSSGNGSGHVMVPDAHQLLGNLVQAVRPAAAPLPQQPPTVAPGGGGPAGGVPGMLGHPGMGQLQGASVAPPPAGAGRAQQAPPHAGELPAPWMQPGALQALMSDPRVAASAKAAASVTAQMQAGGIPGVAQQTWGLPGQSASAPF